MVRERLFREVIFEPFVIDPNIKKMHATQKLGKKLFLAKGITQYKTLK